MIISSVLSFGFLPSLYECVCSSLRTIWIGLFSRFGEQSLLIGWFSIPLSAHRCLYTHSFFCHSLIFIWIFIYFSFCSSSFVPSPALSLSFFFLSLFTLRSVYGTGVSFCVRVRKKNETDFTDWLTFSSLSLCIPISAISRFMRVSEYACVSVYALLWETLSISAVFRFRIFRTI